MGLRRGRIYTKPTRTLRKELAMKISRHISNDDLHAALAAASHGLIERVMTALAHGNDWCATLTTLVAEVRDLRIEVEKLKRGEP